MSHSSQDIYDKNYGEEEFNEEVVTLTVLEEPVPEEPAPEYVMESNVSSSIGVAPPVAPLPTFERMALPGKYVQKTPLPAALPPIKELSRNSSRVVPLSSLEHGWQESGSLLETPGTFVF